MAASGELVGYSESIVAKDDATADLVLLDVVAKGVPFIFITAEIDDNDGDSEFFGLKIGTVAGNAPWDREMVIRVLEETVGSFREAEENDL